MTDLQIFTQQIEDILYKTDKESYGIPVIKVPPQQVGEKSSLLRKMLFFYSLTVHFNQNGCKGAYLQSSFSTTDFILFKPSAIFSIEVA